MTYRETPQGQRQAAALRSLERESGRKRSEIVADLPIEHDQYKRYVRGAAPLRLDQFAPFADAYGVLVGELVRRLGLVEPGVAENDFDMAAYLRGHVLESDIPGKVAKHKHEPPDVQKAAADSYIRMTRRAQRKATSQRNQSA